MCLRCSSPRHWGRCTTPTLTLTLTSTLTLTLNPNPNPNPNPSPSPNPNPNPNPNPYPNPLLEPPPPAQVHGPWLEVRGRVYAYRLGRGGGEARWVRWPRGEKDPTADPAVPVARTESKKSN